MNWDPQRQLPLPLRYDGAERRRSRTQHPDAERRTLDPATEQDHPEDFEAPARRAAAGP